MNAILNTMQEGHTDQVSVTVGTFRSVCKPEVVLVYLNHGQNDPIVVRYDQLAGKFRRLVGSIATDPLGVLGCANHVESGCGSFA